MDLKRYSQVLRKLGTLPIGASKGNIRETHPSGSNFLLFHSVFLKNWSKYLWSTPPSCETLDPPYFRSFVIVSALSFSYAGPHGTTQANYAFKSLSTAHNGGWDTYLASSGKNSFRLHCNPLISDFVNNAIQLNVSKKRQIIRKP